MACKTWASVRAEFTQTIFRYDSHAWGKRENLHATFPTHAHLRISRRGGDWDRHSGRHDRARGDNRSLTPSIHPPLGVRMCTPRIDDVVRLTEAIPDTLTKERRSRRGKEHLVVSFHCIRSGGSFDPLRLRHARAPACRSTLGGGP